MRINRTAKFILSLPVTLLTFALVIGFMFNMLLAGLSERMAVKMAYLNFPLEKIILAGVGCSLACYGLYTICRSRQIFLGAAAALLANLLMHLGRAFGHSIRSDYFAYDAAWEIFCYRIERPVIVMIAFAAIELVVWLIPALWTRLGLQASSLPAWLACRFRLSRSPSEGD